MGWLSIIEYLLLEGLMSLFLRLPVQTKTGIIGGMVGPVIALVSLYTVTYGEHKNTGDGLLLAFLFLALIVGAVVGAISGTIVGTIAKVLIQPLHNVLGSYKHVPTNKSPRLWHNVSLNDPEAFPNFAPTTINRRITMIGGFIGGMIPTTVLLLWFFDII